MWKIIILFYLTTGLAIVLSPWARRVIRRQAGDIDTNKYPVWKVVGFFSIVYAGSMLAWPLFLAEIFTTKKTVMDELNENPLFREQKSLLELVGHMGEDGVDTDEIPHGQGEFGLVSSNPIPCKTIYGGITYLASLRTHEGNKVIYERAGSVASDVTPHPVDKYEISLQDGQKLGVLFISPYHKRNSEKAPRGFMLINPMEQI